MTDAEALALMTRTERAWWITNMNMQVDRASALAVGRVIIRRVLKRAEGHKRGGVA